MNRIKRLPYPITFLVLLVVYILIIIIGRQLPLTPPSEKLSPVAVLALVGDPSNEFDDLTTKIIEDMGLNSIQITVLVGPYFQYLGTTGLLMDDLEPNFYIFLDEIFIQELNPGERRALVAHEVAHILFRPSPIPNRKDTTQTQLLSDEFASRYVNPKHLIGFLDKLYDDYLARRKRLELLAQQGQ